MHNNKKTVIIGATNNPSRYAYLAAERLAAHDHSFIPVSIKKGEVLGEPILNLKNHPEIPEVHTITLYINPSHQKQWEDYILSLSPDRIIFNPGTENPDLVEKAKNAGIETVYGCTLVMLSAGTY
ncbi:CoA-binding protein [Marinoscillum furvescens]|uniref:CoA-binding domain-containing protein n=1 Tax=Marinoscillum furvescens DSM 4134 TaxID=1122208 RepID=A0A3D9KZB3_MARFU|nr:CoA-binding protein [Marinoscillum furvescens]RED95630.1 hypothetical protein C7460_11780 [Marinoscillum furvescens DSM 4134]